MRLSLEREHTADQYELQRRRLAAPWLGVHQPTLFSGFVLVFEKHFTVGVVRTSCKDTGKDFFVSSCRLKQMNEPFVIVYY